MISFGIFPKDVFHWCSDKCLFLWCSDHHVRVDEEPILEIENRKTGAKISMCDVLTIDDVTR